MSEGSTAAEALRAVLYDALRERRNNVGDLVREIADLDPPDVHVLLDGCEGDADGLRAALAQPHVVLTSSCEHEGWGHHSCNVVVAFADGRILHANCGGCSCQGNGDWSWCSTPEEAERLIPEQERPELRTADVEPHNGLEGGDR